MLERGFDLDPIQIRVINKRNNRLTEGTEGSFNFECKDCKKEELKALNKVSQKVLNLRTCNIVSHKRNLGKLSDYWAQELIGSDLMREELEKTAPPEIENFIAVFDSNETDHDIAVKNLISDEGPHAVLPELGERKTSFLNTDPEDMSHKNYIKGKGYKPALSLYDTGYPGDYLFGFNKNTPRYINNSMHWLNSEDIYDVFKRLSSSKTFHPIVVSISGNYFPERFDSIKNKASKNFDVILVGSFSPNGFVSEFSQSSREVSILAPSDYHITSAGEQWDKEQFGGTSGAAPLVTGSLAGFEWLSGYHPTAKEAKVLLEKTALPTLYSFEKPRVNGAGLLNSYKLAKVAKRLKEKCKDNLFCFKEEILKDENYHFAKDKNLKRDLRRVFPSCSEGDSAESSSGCEEKKELFKRLRKEIFLNPTIEYYKNLSCLYKEADFGGNMRALIALSAALRKESEVRYIIKNILARKSISFKRDLVRLALGMGGFEEDFNNEELKEGVQMVSGIVEEGLPSLITSSFENGNLELKKEALKSTQWIGEEALPLLEQAVNTGNREFLYPALNSAHSIGMKAFNHITEIVKNRYPVKVICSDNFGSCTFIFEEAL